MIVLAIDDERPALRLLTDAVGEALPGAEFNGFTKTGEFLEFAKDHPADVAFLDIRIHDVSGLEVAKKLKELQPKINIIFLTGYSEYKGDAMDLHASGYILKPVTAEKVVAELQYLRTPAEESTKENYILKVKTFGNFEVFDKEGKTLSFDRSKAKEALAYLIYRRGTSASSKELHAAIFEDSAYDKNSVNYLQQILQSMMRGLRNADAEKAVIKDYDSYRIDPDRIDCDYYRFLDGDARAVNQYTGEFMAQYTWAEFVAGYLDEIFHKSHE